MPSRLSGRGFRERSASGLQYQQEKASLPARVEPLKSAERAAPIVLAAVTGTTSANIIKNTALNRVDSEGFFLLNNDTLLTTGSSAETGFEPVIGFDYNVLATADSALAALPNAPLSDKTYSSPAAHNVRRAVRLILSIA